MIKDLIKKYYGAILLYGVIVVMIVLANGRFRDLNAQKNIDSQIVMTTESMQQ